MVQSFLWNLIAETRTPEAGARGIRGTLTTLSGLQAKAIGRVRLLCPRLAAKTVLAPKLGQFARDYPGVELDITTDDSRVDLVLAGFDAGIQFGEFIAQDSALPR